MWRTVAVASHASPGVQARPFVGVLGTGVILARAEGVDLVWGLGFGGLRV